MKLSIITATYNLVEAERIETFRQAITSAYTQTFDDVEIVVVDGASTDGTVELIQTLEREGMIDQFISEPDEGIYYAMNKGASIATGDYLLFLNSDDYYHDTNGLSELVEALERTDAEFAFGPSYILGEDNHEVFQPASLKRVIYGVPCCHQTMAVKKQTFFEFGGFDVDIRIAADYDLTMRLAMSSRKHVHNPANFVTFRLGGFSSDSIEIRMSMFQVWMKTYSQFYPLKTSDLNHFWVTHDLPVQLVSNMIQSEQTSLRFKLYLVSYLNAMTRRRIGKTVRKLFGKR